MKKEQLIDFLDETRRSENQVEDLAKKLLFLFGVGNCPDLTDVWNMAVDLVHSEQITIFEMNNIWGALRLLEKQGNCKLAESWD